MPRLGKMLQDVETTIAQLPDDKYIVELKFEDTKSKRTGSSMIVMTCKVLGGDFDGRELSEYYTYLKADGTSNDAGLRGLKRVMVPLLGEEVVEGEDFDPCEHTGLQAEVYIKGDTYPDEITGDPVQTNRIARVLGLA